MKEEEKLDKVEIISNFGQDIDRAKRFGDEIAEYLKPLQEQGLLKFNTFIRRKCDWCGKTLEEGDKYKTMGDKDICEECERRKKENGIKKRV